MTKNQIVTARIDGYSAEGAGILHTDGRAVFVPGAIRDELWEARILKVTASAVWGRGERLLEGSPHRRESDCAAFPRCGGCALRHMDYEEELNLKLRRVNDTLERIGGTKLRIETILPAGTDARKRRKVIFNVGERDGRPIAGFYRARTHDIVPAEDCPAVTEDSLRCAGAVMEWMDARGVPAYDEAAKRNGVRHIFYRSSRFSEKAVLTLTVSSSPAPGDLDTLVSRLRERCGELSGIVLNLNASRGNTVLAGEFRTLWGSDTLEEELLGLRFRLSPRSFFQVNPPQAERLYEKTMEYAAVTEGTPALDLYCGTGTLALCMAKRGGQVIGAEVVTSAVENARANAEANGLSDRCEFLCADAGAAAEELRRRGQRPEVILVDPPRKGLSPEVIAAAAGMEPERIVYVSCDPATLARDLKSFEALGYSAVKGAAVDMFPRTGHVETVCCMYHQKKDFISVPYAPKDAEYLKK